MAKDIDRVCEKYELKLRTGRMPGRVDDDRAGQAEAYRRAQANNDLVRRAVAAVLGRAGVETIWWVYYYGFGWRLARLAARIGSPDVLRQEARMQLEVWVARGLARGVLVEIGRECFELELGGPVPTLAAEAETAEGR